MVCYCEWVVVVTVCGVLLRQVLPEYRGELMKQTAIFIPSYFDFVRIRNYMKKEGLSFAQICE